MNRVPLARVPVTVTPIHTVTSAPRVMGQQQWARVGPGRDIGVHDRAHSGCRHRDLDVTQPKPEARSAQLTGPGRTTFICPAQVRTAPLSSQHLTSR